MNKQTTSTKTGNGFLLDELLTVPEAYAITLNNLKRLDLSSVLHGTTLRLCVDSLTVLIHRGETWQVRLIYQIKPEHPWAIKYGTNEMAHATRDAIGEMPEGTMPQINASAWIHPDKVSWEFLLPLTITRKELQRVIVASLNCVKLLTLGLLKRRFPETGALVL